jgi:hypothetical protein
MATTSSCCACSRSMTGFQLADSAKAPWTRAMVGLLSDLGLLLSVGGSGVVMGRGQVWRGGGPSLSGR